MSRTIKKQPKRERPRKLKPDDEKKTMLKRSSIFDFPEDDFDA
jgi:hypothetical protein